MYPTISEYLEAIKSAEDNFEQLKHLRPVLEDDGSPIMTSGNFAVVFKMKDEQTGKLHAVKCFLREQEGRAEAYRQTAEELEFVSSTFLTPIKYLDKELFVDTNAGDEKEFPVLLMDWVEGQTLDKYIREHIDDQYELSLLAYQFSRLAMWLMPQPFAHGDLKPDNILVKEDGTLVLVDYDGMYVPAMKGQKARELGSPDFRHPGRTEEVFDEHIDDFSLASILLSLKAIALQPSLLEEYGASDRLLFSEKDYRNLSESSALGALQPLMHDAELASLYSLYILALSQNNLSQVSFRLFNLSRPDKSQYEEENLSTEVTEEDLTNAWTDEYGVKYSADRKRLLEATTNISHYSIKDGTRVICNGAFECCLLKSVNIPQSVCVIGELIFCDLNSLKHITVDVSNRRYDSRNNCNAIIETASNKLIYGSPSTIIPPDIEVIGDEAFSFCESIKEIVIPSNVKVIGRCAFAGCKNLKSISIPDSVSEIRDEAFLGCKNIHSVIIPKNVRSIGHDVFGSCHYLSSISVDENNTYFDSRDCCNAIIKTANNTLIAGCSTTTIPTTVIEVGDSAFFKCQELKSVKIPNGVKRIGYNAFEQCHNIKTIFISATINVIEYSAFCKCENIVSIVVDKENNKYDSRGNCNAIVETNSNTLVVGCNNTIIPSSITSIGAHAFCGRKKLVSIALPKYIKEIRENAFNFCESLNHIIVPQGELSRFEKIYPSLKGKYVESAKLSFSPLGIANLSIIEGSRIIYDNNKWVAKCNFIKGRVLKSSLLYLLANEGVPVEEHSVKTLRLFGLERCDGFYINPEVLYFAQDSYSYITKISFDSDNFSISGINWGLHQNKNEWRTKAVRSFTMDELAAVARAEVVPSQYGNSVCFFMNGGGQTYIPLLSTSSLTVGDSVDLKTAKLVTLCQEGKDDIYRVLE